MSNIDNIVNSIYEEVSKINNISILTDSVDYDKLDALCKEYLSSRGYTVNKIILDSDINTIDDLVIYFYNTYEYYLGSRAVSDINFDKDRAILKRFVKSRQKDLGVSYESAISEVAFLIKVLFKYRLELKLDNDIGIWIFSSDKCRWIITKLISIINNESNKINEDKVLAMADECERREACNYNGFDLDLLELRY